MVAEIRPNYPTEWAAMKSVAAKLGVCAIEAASTWVRTSQGDAGFSANITIDGEFPPEAVTLADLVDESVEQLRRAGESVVATDRREIGSEDAPALTQRVTFSAIASDARRDLVQSQVYLALLDMADPHKSAVIRLTLTATAAQYDEVLKDFQDFVRTVRPDTGTEA
ncbi:hypothetical protein [Streptomyces yerevanensis]|uniref:hypothetical protein n=1 Tax=Streptomyces yerevanensis TaxID=66378 RepID=UPI000AD24A0E|nr:hypothetical protein [Streptomyces yerevanensis]